jgi:urease accessory protein
MMSDDELSDDTFSLLQMLQHGDSQFPSGSFAFSTGLEALYEDGRIDSVEGLAQFVEGQLRYRWATLDRVALVKTLRLGSNLNDISELDREVEIMGLAKGLREGSQRNGNALLGMHVRLQTPMAADYRAKVSNGSALGHIPVVQGLVWGQSGISEFQAQAAAAHGVCSDLLSAAMRLGRVGHVHAQKIRSRMNPIIMRVLEDPVEPETLMHAYVAAAEIATMRHETSELRLFAS